MAAAVEALVCIMHLVLFELWIPQKGLKNDWVMHLDAASALLSSVDLSISSASSSNPVPYSPYTDPGKPSEIASIFPIELLSDGEKSAFEFFFTLYTHCLVNSAASLGLTPQSAASVQRTRTLFHNDQGRLKNMLGCEDWAMNTILDIAVLREWKTRMHKSGTLSLRELTRRADILEERLNEGLATLASRQSMSRSAKERQQDIITTIYVNGSLVFLHVVVSGFYPNLSEIRKSVLQTLDALEAMRNRSATNLKTNIPSWPFCVAGCLALETEYSRFRALLPPHRKGTHPLVMTKWTLEIIEQCWKIRSTQSEGEESCDWVTAMNQLGTRLLLV